MSEEEHSATGHLKGFILILALLFLAWFVTNQENKQSTTTTTTTIDTSNYYSHQQ
ncbi:MAG: hypothetical protein V4439_02300 [Patescibacteria group bacterium]